MHACPGSLVSLGFHLFRVDHDHTYKGSRINDRQLMMCVDAMHEFRSYAGGDEHEARRSLPLQCRV